MKKLLALALCLAMLLSMVACGTTDAPETSDPSHSNSSAEAPNTPTPEAPSAPTPEAPSTPTPDVPKEPELVFEEIVAVDNEECTIKITGVDPDNWMGFGLNVYLENKSPDKTYMFSVSSAAVDGVASDPYFATEVAAGKKANNKITFSNADLGDNNIGFTDIELTFRVYDSEDWMADPVTVETIHVYPYGEENAVTFVREPQSTDTVLVDNDYVTVIVTGCGEDDIWGYTVDLFLINKTDAEVMFSADDVSVNGYMADPYYARSVIAGKCAFSSMSWSDMVFEENGITDVESIEFLLRAYESGSWGSADFVNEIVTFDP